MYKGYVYDWSRSLFILPKTHLHIDLMENSMFAGFSAITVY